ncbi:kinase [Candidatus Gottesmanbacteria bacterium]|nr:kinase [Candidatus Gottesmanbacteria bacterium]
MVISKTPYRVSFFGGGTDYPAWYRENGGAVLATTINKYCYITCRHLPPFFGHKHRIVWSKIENVKKVSQIKHPAVREILKYLKIKDGIELHHDGDLPARSGLGTSSSFVVGLLHALYTLYGTKIDKKRLAEEAIRVEQFILKNNVGSQDQVMAAFGGLNKVTFLPDGQIKTQLVKIAAKRKDDLQRHLMLVFTGLTRNASDVAGQQIKNIPKKKKELKYLCQLVTEGQKILEGNDSLEEFGKLLHESWRLKKSLSDRISSPQIDKIYEVARKFGAVGGKLLGAGGGGFILLFAHPDSQKKIKDKTKKFLHVPFQFEDKGSEIIFSQK